jgi:hypothetical protein
MKIANAIPSQALNVALPLPLYTQLGAYLFSELEGRVPHGAYSRFMIELLRKFFTQESIDLAPYVGSPAGAFVIDGAPETIAALERLLAGEATCQ